VLPAGRKPLRVLLFSLAGIALGLGACTSGQGPSAGPPGASSTSAPAPRIAEPAAVRTAPLAPGERWINVPMPGGTYRPQAPSGGTDDYRCILLDPKLRHAVFLSGAVLEPGNPKLVHHAILYRVDPGEVAAAERADAADPRLGWSCFGDVGIGRGSGQLGFLDAAPWVAAWATNGGEQRFPSGTGQRLAAGSRLILQMHYNLLNGGGVDDTEVRLRVADASASLKPLHTMLLPAPVELPCAAGQHGPLCDRTAAVFDVVRRFGQQASWVIAGLQLLCGGSPDHPHPGVTQTCARSVPRTMQIRAVAGHMHLLGRSVRIDLERADGTTRRLLNVPLWNFDDQRATVLARPVTARPGDRLRVTCTHDPTLRDKLPELAKLPERYVVWGEGTSDEMCLGIVSYTT
jgi:Copper type II ascorbate-dependent monooxygenase, C-terminal domain